MLLSILITNDNVTDIYQALPPPQPFLDATDSAYRHSMPRNVLRTVLEDNRAVWPIVGFKLVDRSVCISDTETKKPSFTDIRSVLISSPGDDDATVAALGMAGISITRSPEYIIDLLHQMRADFNRLTPTSAHQRLLVS